MKRKLIAFLAVGIVVSGWMLIREWRGPDFEAERTALRQAVDVDMINALRAKDIDRLVEFYTDDASMFPPNAPIATGKEAIRAVWLQFAASASLASRTTRIEVSRAGDLAYGFGTYEVTMNDPTSNRMTERGKWVVVWKKQTDGTWKWAADIWNSDQPPAAVAPKP